MAVFNWQDVAGFIIDDGISLAAVVRNGEETNGGVGVSLVKPQAV